MPWFLPSHPSSAPGATESIGALTPCASGPVWPQNRPQHALPHHNCCSDKYAVSKYIELWETKKCRKMTAEERETLKRGCIGITCINLGMNNLDSGQNPPLDNAYDTLAKAKLQAANMRTSCGSRGLKPRIFSLRFWSNGKAYTPDPSTGKVDMSSYNYESRVINGRPLIPFDYGFYDEDADVWWHANHSDPGMEVYRSTSEGYSSPLLNFDKQVFCVACGDP